MTPADLPAFLFVLIFGAIAVVGVCSLVVFILNAHVTRRTRTENKRQPEHDRISSKATAPNETADDDISYPLSFERIAEYEAVPLLTPAEMSLYRCLVQLYGTKAIICPKVRLADVIQPRKGLSRDLFQGAFNRISRKHLDFVIMRTDNLAVIGAIELDDRSHELKARVERDTFVNEALQVAGVPLCRIKVQRGYHLETLCAQINAVFYPSHAVAAS